MLSNNHNLTHELLNSDVFQDRYSNLEGRCLSDKSIDLTRMMAGDISNLSEGGYAFGYKRRDALAGLIFDSLIVESSSFYNWSYISLHKPSFAGKEPGYRSLKWAYDGLQALGIICAKPRDYKQGIGKAGGAEAARYKLTPHGLSYLLEGGITPSNFKNHFQRSKPKEQAVLHSIQIRGRKGGTWRKPRRGELLSVDMADPDVMMLANRIQRINAFLLGHQIDGCEFNGLYRLFNEGDQPGFAFDKGGRLYCYGNYQQMEQVHRRLITINVEPVVEVDVSGSHAFLYHALRGVPLLPGIDPYKECGIGSRFVAKLCVNMMLGNGRPLSRWPTDAKEAYLAKELGIKLAKGERYTQEQLGFLQRDYPIGKVTKAVMSGLPLLRNLPDSGITWADLQYRESLGLIATVETLAFEHGVPALPLHDSVIVPASKAAIAEQVLKEQFWKEAEVRIGVKVKG